MTTSENPPRHIVSGILYLGASECMCVWWHSGTASLAITIEVYCGMGEGRGGSNGIVDMGFQLCWALVPAQGEALQSSLGIKGSHLPLVGL